MPEEVILEKGECGWGFGWIGRGKGRGWMIDCRWSNFFWIPIYALVVV